MLSPAIVFVAIAEDSWMLNLSWTDPRLSLLRSVDGGEPPGLRDPAL
jgi:hypothetical protein